jgi:hypothetical protein
MTLVMSLYRTPFTRDMTLGMVREIVVELLDKGI